MAAYCLRWNGKDNPSFDAPIFAWLLYSGAIGEEQKWNGNRESPRKAIKLLTQVIISYITYGKTKLEYGV